MGMGEDVLYVCDVGNGEDSPLQRYNDIAPRDRRILVGDYVTQVNGIPDSSKVPVANVANVLKQELLQAKVLEVRVRRPHLFECDVQKKGLPLGLELAHSS